MLARPCRSRQAHSVACCAVIEGKDLLKVDRWSESDPYVVITMGNTWFATPVVQDNCNPVWKNPETYHFEVRDRKDRIVLDVFDKNTAEKDGACAGLACRALLCFVGVCVLAPGRS